MEPKVEEKKWLVVYTKPRTEISTAERLSSKGLKVYCPTQVTIRQWSDRKKKLVVPIFPSYVFVNVSETERRIALEDVNVMRFLFWLGKPAIVREVEMENLMTFLKEYEQDEMEVEFEKGSKVVIDQGPFMDQEGVVVDIKNKRPVIALPELGIKLVAKPNMELRRNEKG